jgi:hypothetical protein
MQEPSRTERVGHLAKMSFTAQPISLALVVVNVVGAIAYVVAASNSWAIPQERGLVPIAGEPFVWAFSILPIVAIFSVLNIAWGAVILTRRQWQGGSLWLLAAVVWLGAVVIDFAHH